MNFFQQMFDLIDGIDVNINIKRKNGKLTMSVLPQTASSITPALITGTPDELDEGFFDAIKVPLDTAKGLKADLEQFNASVANAKENAAAAPVKKDSPATTKIKAEIKTKLAPKKSKGPEVVEASLFDEQSDQEVDEALTKETESAEDSEAEENADAE